MSEILTPAQQDMQNALEQTANKVLDTINPADGKPKRKSYNANTDLIGLNLVDKNTGQFTGKISDRDITYMIFADTAAQIKSDKSTTPEAKKAALRELNTLHSLNTKIDNHDNIGLLNANEVAMEPFLIKLKQIVRDNYVPAFNGEITANPSRFEPPLIAPPPPAEMPATEFMKERSAPEPQDQVAPRPLTVPGAKAPIVIESPSLNKTKEVAPPPPAEPPAGKPPEGPTLLPPDVLRNMNLSAEQLKALDLPPLLQAPMEFNEDVPPPSKPRPPANKTAEPDTKPLEPKRAPLLVPNEGLSSENPSETSLGGLETQGFPAKPVTNQSAKPVRR